MGVRKVVVTGGGGFIGGCMTKLLVDRGYSPVVMDNFATSSRRVCPGATLEEVDLADYAAAKEAFSRHPEAELVFHFAAFALVGESCADTDRYFRNNILSTLNVARLCREFSIINMVFSSSCSIYGKPTTEKLTEDHPKNPLSPYGESKLIGEQILRQFTAHQGLRVVCLRYFNPAGSMFDGDFGENHEPETHLIPLVVRAGISDETVKVFGEDYDTPDGTCIRDFIHIADLTMAHLEFAGLLLDGTLEPFSAFNLGTGEGTSVKSILAIAEQVLGRKLRAEIVGRRPGDAERLVADVKLAHAVSSWRAQYSVGQMVKDHLAFVTKALS